MINFEETQYGFNYGAAKINRITSDDKKGWVVIGLDTKKESIQLYVTKTGKVRIYTGSTEWIKEKK